MLILLLKVSQKYKVKSMIKTVQRLQVPLTLPPSNLLMFLYKNDTIFHYKLFDIFLIVRI